MTLGGLCCTFLIHHLQIGYSPNIQRLLLKLFDLYNLTIKMSGLSLHGLNIQMGQMPLFLQTHLLS